MVLVRIATIRSCTSKKSTPGIIKRIYCIFVKFFEGFPWGRISSIWIYNSMYFSYNLDAYTRCMTESRTRWTLYLISACGTYFHLLEVCSWLNYLKFAVIQLACCTWTPTNACLLVSYGRVLRSFCRNIVKKGKK